MSPERIEGIALDGREMQFKSRSLTELSADDVSDFQHAVISVGEIGDLERLGTHVSSIYAWLRLRRMMSNSIESVKKTQSHRKIS
jgi:hypothetical protein